MILGHGERPARVVTRAGRPIADVAAAHGIEVVTVERANADPAAVVPPGADLGVSMAWGELIGHDLLARPALGWLNAHPSALPAYRGSDPIGWQLVTRPPAIGLSIHEMAAHFDDGRIVRSGSLELRPGETRGDLETRAIRALAELVADVLAAGPGWSGDAQSGPPSMCPPVGVTAMVMPDHMTAAHALGVVLAFSPAPGAGVVGHPRLVGGARLGRPLGRGDVPGQVIPVPGRAEVACLDGWILVDDVAPPEG